MWQELDNRLMRADPDRRMATLFAPRTIRRRLIALYAFNDELARIRDRVTEPMLGDLRLAWWREVVEEIYDPDAEVRGHEAALGLSHAFSSGAPPRVWIDRMINVRARDLDAEPFQTIADLKQYADRSAATLMRAAVWLTLPGEDISAAGEAAIKHAGIAWAMTGMLRGFAADLAHNRRWLPQQAYDEAGVSVADMTRDQDPEAARALFKPVIASIRREHREARARFADLPSEAAPALLYASLIPAYLDRMSRPDYDAFTGKGEPPLILRQARMVWASATGRL